MKKKVKSKKPKSVVRRRKRTMYKCTSNNVNVRRHIMQELNEHGAFNDKWVETIVYDITFVHNPAVGAYQPLPEVVSAIYNYVTTNKSIAEKYNVGEEYTELPR